MTIALLGENATAFGNKTITYTPAVGSYLAVYASDDADITAVSDAGGNTYSPASVSISNGFFVRPFVSSRITVSQLLTITLTSTGTTGNANLFVAEFGGSSGFQVTAGQPQNTPGAGTDAITSGLIGVLSPVPAMIHAICMTLGPAVPASHGTGYATGTASGWSGSVTSEFLRVTVGTSVAATFTHPAGATDNFITVTTVFSENAFTPFTQTQFFVTDTVIQQ